MRRVPLLVMSLLLALPATAQVYQWRDAQGRMNYSDTPPPSAPAKTLKPAPRSMPGESEVSADETAVETANGQTPDAQPANGDEAAKAPGAKTDAAKPKTMAEKEAEFRQRRVAAAEAEAKAEKERQQAAEKSRSCEQARSQLMGLKSGQRVSRFNAQGERELLDDAQRGAEIERTERFLAQNCK